MIKNTLQKLVRNTKQIQKLNTQQISQISTFKKVQQLKGTQQINYTPNYNFFWGKSKEEKQKLAEEQKKELKKNSNNQTEDEWQNIGYLVENLKKDNQKKPKIIPPKSIKLEDKLTVVVEMDEVLAYVFSPDEFETYMSAPQSDYDYLLNYKEYDTYLSVYKRPHLEKFLEYLRENTEPILYCTGVRSYVEMVMEQIDPNNTFEHIICQEEGTTRITNQDENIDDYIKDLNLLGRDLSRTVYIDSKAFQFWTHPDNAIAIQEYMADSTIDDNELLNMINLLEEIKNEKDVRDLLSERFEIRKALQDSKML